MRGFITEVSLETIMPFYREPRSSFETSKVELSDYIQKKKGNAEHRMEKVLTSLSHPLPSPGLLADMDSEAPNVVYFRPILLTPVQS